VLARQARLEFLMGDGAAARATAARAAKNAVDTATFGTSLAYYSLLQGQIELDTGHYAAAVTAYRAALRAAPGWHTALAGLARATAASGDLAAAAQLWQQAVAVVPQPEYLAALGDVEAALGRPAAARQQWATVQAAGQVGAATGQLYNRQLVLFDADHGRDPAGAVRMARAELAVRHDAAGWDALGWALHADGRDAEALSASRTALSWGTPDPRFLLHAGFAAAGTGDDADAVSYLRRGLGISPHVDPLLAPRAVLLLDRLTGTTP
jgi:tetratricopeptide (TPR) repeat protein